MFVERMIQKIAPGKWADLEALDKKFNAYESKAGFPPKRRLRAFFGQHNVDTLIVEREWDSMAALEAAMLSKSMMDPAYQALQAETVGIIESMTWEIYMVL